MKAILPLALLAALSAGCGSGSKAAAGPITITGTTTMATVKTGTTIRCKNGPGAAVPPPGQGVSGIADPVAGASGGEIQLRRKQDGTLVAVCRRN